MIEMMRYRDWAPTAFDPKGAFLPDRQRWFVAPKKYLKRLGGESSTVEVHKFNHWTTSFEIILVHPDKRNRLQSLIRRTK